MLSHRTDDLYAYTAKDDGRIVEKTDKHVIVEYKDGTKVTIEIGRRFGSFDGVTIPHMIACDLKEGQRVKKGEIVTYNSNYFVRDRLDKKQVLWKAGIIAKTALLEGTDTFEDSSAISPRLAEKMKTELTKVRMIRVNFDQEIHNLVKPGDEVDIESILCTIENPVGAGDSLFAGETLETLKAISSLTPKAKIIGRVEKIEVLYNGDKDDMSASLKKITNASDREIARNAEAIGKPKTDGRVDSGYRIENRPLEMDSLVIKVYMTGPQPAGVGDKGVFGSQMKTVFGRVMAGVNETESGEPLDAFFGMQSIADRTATSPILIGTTNTLLIKAGQLAVAAYRGKGSS